MYSFNSRIRYSETDKHGFLSLEGLMNYFQDCSGFQTEDLGVGLAYQAERNITWMLVSWHVEITRLPYFGEEVEIGTSPYLFRGIMGKRNFMMKDAKGEILAIADSEWVLMDTKSGSFAKVPEDMAKAYPIEEPLEMEKTGRKITILENQTASKPVVVGPAFLDTNGHVNNVKYISVAEGLLPEENKIKSFRVEYKKQAFLGDIMTPYISQNEEVEQVVLHNQNDEILVCIEFKKVEMK